MTYIKPYVEGRLPVYKAPKTAFTPGGNGVGVVTAVGKEVWHVKPGQRVVISSHLLAGENVDEPAQLLIGLTALGPVSEAMQTDWPHGMLAEYALVPKASLTVVEGLDHLPSTDAAALRQAAGGGAHMALDMVGSATNANSTLAALRSLHGKGRLILMGSMSVPLPVPYLEMMVNGWEIMGNFMYPRIPTFGCSH
jgi:NADPH:quinone reductase-like Zn-dependent oxidoreductase